MKVPLRSGRTSRSGAWAEVLVLVQAFSLNHGLCLIISSKLLSWGLREFKNVSFLHNCQ